jgi:hypothetical protein
VRKHEIISIYKHFGEKAIVHGMNQSLNNPWLIKYSDRYALFSQTLLLSFRGMNVFYLKLKFLHFKEFCLGYNMFTQLGRLFSASTSPPLAVHHRHPKCGVLHGEKETIENL